MIASGDKTVIDTGELRELARGTDAVNSEISDLRAALLQLPPQLPVVDPFGELAVYGQADPVGVELLNSALDAVQRLQSVMDADRRSLEAEATQVEAEEGAPPAIAPAPMAADGRTVARSGGSSTSAAAGNATPFSGAWISAGGALSATGAFVAASGQTASDLRGGARLIAPGGNPNDPVSTGSGPGATDGSRPASASGSGGQTGPGQHEVTAQTSEALTIGGTTFHPSDLPSEAWHAITSLFADAGHAAAWLATEGAHALAGLATAAVHLAGQVLDEGVKIAGDIGNEALDFLGGFEDLWVNDINVLVGGSGGILATFFTLLSSGAGYALSVVGGGPVVAVVGTVEAAGAFYRGVESASGLSGDSG